MRGESPFPVTSSRSRKLARREQDIKSAFIAKLTEPNLLVDSIEQPSGNGYIWHTTGSSETLRSVKASTLLRDSPAIDKCLFVVDHKDLDRPGSLSFISYELAV